MAGFELAGNIIVKDDTQDVSASFKKREFVIEVINERNTDYNDFIKFQLTQDRCEMLDHYTVGQEVKISFNVRGRKWEKDGKTNYFSNLEAWRIESVGNASAPAPQQTEAPSGGKDSLPF